MTESKQYCPLCLGKKYKFQFELNSPYKQYKNFNYKIYLCLSCRLEYVWPRPSLEFIKEFYKGYKDVDIKEVVSYYQSTKNELSFGGLTESEFFVKKIKKIKSPPAKVMDVACGNGYHLYTCQKHGFEICGMDIDYKMIEVCKNVYNIAPNKLIEGSFEELNINDSNLKNNFDIVILSQVLEHVINPRLWLEKSIQLLDDNGYLCIAVPNHGCIEKKLLKNRFGFYCPPEHLNYYTIDSFKSIQKDFNLKLIEVFSRNCYYVSLLQKNKYTKRLAYLINYLSDKILSPSLNGRYLYVIMKYAKN